MKHHHFKLMCLVFFAQVQLHLPFTSAFSSSSNAGDHLDLFWQSIDRLRDDLNGRYTTAAVKVAKMIQNNGTYPSPCFRLIELALQSGLSEEWSAKCWCFYSSLTLLNFTEMCLIYLQYSPPTASLRRTCWSIYSLSSTTLWVILIAVFQ